MHKSTLRHRRRVWLPIIFIGVFALLFIVASTSWSKGDDQASIEEIFSSYYKNMNEGNYEKMLDFYTNDAVMMEPFAPSRIGKKAISEEFRKAFERIAFNFTYDIREFVISREVGFSSSQYDRDHDDEIDRTIHCRQCKGIVCLESSEKRILDDCPLYL